MKHLVHSEEDGRSKCNANVLSINCSAVFIITRIKSQTYAVINAVIAFLILIQHIPVAVMNHTYFHRFETYSLTRSVSGTWNERRQVLTCLFFILFLEGS